MILTKHLFQCIFFRKVLSNSNRGVCSNFLIIKEENYSSLQDKILSHRKINVLLIFKNSDVTACDPSHPLKLKDLIFGNK